ncbi:MAG TPA: hypothetical protein VGD66_00525 [Allosphingosinicella sp.]|jgi:hypothetical protein
MNRTLLIAALLLPTACATAPPAPPMPPDLEQCGDGEAAFNYLEIEAAPARQGRTLRIVPSQRRGAGTYVLPLECTMDWSLSDSSLATLSDDRKSLRIAEGATPGATLTIMYRVGLNPKLVRASVPIVAKDAFVLTGRRSQKAVEGCPGLDPIGELEFTADGHFAVTWQPFETYQDYWGTYRLDPGTGALSMTVDGGNNKPGGLDLEGKVDITPDGALVLEDMYLGQPSGRDGFPPAPAACRYTF